MKIHIKNLRLRTVVGVYEWERTQAQEVVLNIDLEFDGAKAGQSDRIEDTIDYKALKRRVMAEVESSSFQLLERLATRVMEIIREDSRITAARVQIDKPGALRFADSVSVEVSF